MKDKVKIIDVNQDWRESITQKSVFRFFPYALAMIVLPLLCLAASGERNTFQNLPVNWTVPGTFVNPTIVILQDANNLVIRIGTFQKAVAKTAFTKLTTTVIVHDTAWRVLDPRQSSDYIQLAQQFTEAMAERDSVSEALRVRNLEYANAIRVMKQLKSEIDRDTIIQVRVCKGCVITLALPVKK